MTLTNWDKVATEYKYIKSEEGDICRKHILFPILDTLLENYPKGKALDIGCGAGLVVKKLDSFGYEAKGFDFSKGMISIASEKYPEATYYVHDLQEPFAEKPESFDLVTSVLVFQDVNDETYEHSLREIYKVLKPGGILLSVIPHPNFIGEFHNLINAFHSSYMTHRKATYIWKNGITIGTDFYLRPLSYYVNSIIGNKFKISKIVEPTLTVEHKEAFPGEFDRKKEIPGFLIVECVK